MPPIVVCTVGGKCLPVLAASIKAYAPDAWLLVSQGDERTFGEAYNDAMERAFKDHDEILIANDDIVLTPTTISQLMADVAMLKAQHGDQLGFVGTMADNVRWDQSIRIAHDSGVRQVRAVSPLLAWVSKTAFMAARFPPLNWYSDDVICEDLSVFGFKHFVSTAYVHHAGSQTIGHDSRAHMLAALPWLQENRPHLAAEWIPDMTPKKPKICVYAIAKDEEKHVSRFCESAADADIILIADTGSTDRTVEAARDCGATVYSICISPWRFDSARNAALALVPADVDICISLDLDEVMTPGWREEVERLWVPGTTRLSYRFDCGGGYIINHKKIHARHGYVWKHLCHEYPTPDRIYEVVVETDWLASVHMPDTTKSRGQYLDMLFAAAKENPQEFRASFYYARELFFTARWDHSIAEATRALTLPGATWNKERCYLYRIMARCHARMGNGAEALRNARLAVIEDPDTREAWCELAEQARGVQSWGECLGAALRALSIKNRDVTFTNDPATFGVWPHELAAVASFNLGLIDAAKSHANDALLIDPECERIKELLRQNRQ